MIWKNILKIFILLTGLQIVTLDQPCQSKVIKRNYSVCVCNSTYCDTISPINKLNSGKIIVYTSNEAGLRFVKTEGEFEAVGNSKNNLINVGEKEYQTIHGFGGAFTDAAGINIKSLDSKAQQLLLRCYFGPDGIEYTLGRVPIGCSDFSTHPYTYDDVRFEDPELEYFKLAEEDYKYKIPLLQEAIKLSNNTLNLTAVAWTSPKWMKIFASYAGLYTEIKKKMYQSYANYHLKFLESYDKNNITFWGISTGNEPSVGYVIIPIPSTAFTPWELKKWIRNHFGPTIRGSKYSSIKILVLDEQRPILKAYLNTMFKDPEVRNYTDGIALHWYFDAWAPGSVLDDIQKDYPEKFLIATESCEGQYFWGKRVDLGNWHRAESVAKGIIDNFRHSVMAWIDWNLALNPQGGPTYILNNVDSPIIVDAAKKQFYKQPMFYALGHFSKFVPRGSKRIEVSQFHKNVQTIGFKRPDGGIVVIILNTNKNIIYTTIKDKNRRQIPLQLTARSITSIVYWE